MTNTEADELLSNNDWATWSDARALLQEVYMIGYRRGHDAGSEEAVKPAANSS